MLIPQKSEMSNIWHVEEPELKSEHSYERREEEERKNRDKLKNCIPNEKKKNFIYLHMSVKKRK